MLVFVNANLIDGACAKPRKGERVLIDDSGVIAAIGRDYPIPEGAEVLDLEGRTLMPGLIDAHGHLGDHPLLDGAGLDNAERSHDYRQMRELTLAAGVTAIRSCGDFMYDIVAVRDKVNEGKLVGPRMHVSGKTFLDDHGHPATTVWANDPETMGGCGCYPKTPEEARAGVREMVDANVDFIKIIIADTQIFLWPEGFAQLKPEVIEAIIDEAHKYDKRVACHVDHVDQAMMAVGYGADEIHHLIAPASERHEKTEYAELFTLMNKKSVWLVPTLTVPRAFEPRRIAKDCKLSGINDIFPVFRMAYEFGVHFACGCDSGCPGVPWGKSLHQELADYVYIIGMSPIEAIRSATHYNAKMMRMENVIGQIKVGNVADLLVLKKDPSRDIGNIASTYLVLREGKIVVDNRQ